MSRLCGELQECILTVDVGVPALGGYLIPLDGQEPAEGASLDSCVALSRVGQVKNSLMGTYVPSMPEPFRLKYQ